MDYFDYRPRFSPIVNSSACRFSVGFYRGKHRVVIAWFADEQAAADYCRRCSLDRPYIKFDYLQSLF